jgi:glycogen(starch) synthase
MKIAFTSRLYLPLLGGSIVVLDRLSREFIRQGHSVTILTETPGDGLKSGSEWKSKKERWPAGEACVCRFADITSVVSVLREADQVIMIEMSLEWLLAILLAGKRPIVTHHTHFVPLDGKVSPTRILQYLAGLLIPSTACSAMIAAPWGNHVGVLPNPYDDTVFCDTGKKRDIDFMFAGRIGSEKGVGVFVEALASISRKYSALNGRLPVFAIAGKGPEEADVRKLIRKHGLDSGIAHFATASSSELADLYNRTEHVVIPSLWQEPFGLVAIEALACGCHLICSDQPGLREASGNLARYFKTGDVEGLAEIMIDVSVNAQRPDPEKIRRHLESYKVASSAKKLLCLAKRRDNSGSLPSSGLATVADITDNDTLYYP